MPDTFLYSYIPIDLKITLLSVYIWVTPLLTLSDSLSQKNTNEANFHPTPCLSGT